MKIVCLGDSLTEGDYGIYGKSGIANVQEKGYPYFLQKSTGAQVLNFGRCGYTATMYLAYYRSGAVDLQGADIVVIMLGSNGGMDPDRETQENLNFVELIGCCRKDAPDAQIVLCTPPHATQDPAKSNYGYAEQVQKAVLFVRRCAAELNCGLIDIAAYDGFSAETEDVMQPNDGLHFGETGYRVLAQVIEDGLKEITEKRSGLGQHHA